MGRGMRPAQRQHPLRLFRFAPCLNVACRLPSSCRRISGQGKDQRGPRRREPGREAGAGERGARQKHRGLGEGVGGYVAPLLLAIVDRSWAALPRQGGGVMDTLAVGRPGTATASIVSHEQSRQERQERQAARKAVGGGVLALPPQALPLLLMPLSAMTCTSCTSAPSPSYSPSARPKCAALTPRGTICVSR
jgi:hypothetical protein